MRTTVSSIEKAWSGINRLDGVKETISGLEGITTETKWNTKKRKCFNIVNGTGGRGSTSVCREMKTVQADFLLRQAEESGRTPWWWDVKGKNRKMESKKWSTWSLCQWKPHSQTTEEPNAVADVHKLKELITAQMHCWKRQGKSLLGKRRDPRWKAPGLRAAHRQHTFVWRDDPRVPMHCGILASCRHL